MGTRLTMSTAFHPQTDGQFGRTIQVLEDMLRACVLDHKGSWEEHLPLVEFAYNNSYQARIQMAPYEALYGRPCRSPLCWTEVGESSITGPDLIRDTFEKVSLIRQRLLMAQSRQKSYADVRRRPLEFEVGDHVFLKVMPKRGVVRFGKRGKLSPRFIGPFEILERVGTVAYRLALPPSMSGVHEVFHVSMLRKYTPDPTHVVDWGHIEVDTDGTFEEGPVRIIDSRDQVLRRKTVRSTHHKIHFSINLLTYSLLHSQFFFSFSSYIHQYKPTFRYLYVKQLMEDKPCHTYSPLQNVE